MAEVYLAHDEVLDREVAIKILRDQYAGDEEFVERFRREAQSAARLTHPHIVSIYDRGRSEDGAYYIAMEYVPRGTLKERISRDAKLAPGMAAGVALQIADALSAAHENGVIHRDIKPQNVLVTRTGDVKVTDFGIARAAAAPLTSTSAILGTAGYMSPEQAMGKPVGPRSDLYSLGVLLYEMLTGELPYSAESPVALAMKHVHEPPRSPREVNPNVPKSLDTVTLKLLAKDPEDRYASAARLADDLERVGSGLSPAAAEEEDAVIDAPLSPPSTASKGQTTKTAVRPPVAYTAGAPERSGRRRGGILRALATLLLIVVLLGGAVWALKNFSLEPGGSGEQSGANQPPAPAAEVPSTTLVPDLYWASEAAGLLNNAGLQLGNRTDVPNEVVPAGVVIETNPFEGAEAEQGTAVDIIVSTGPAQAAPVAQPGPGSAAVQQPQRQERSNKEENPKGKGKQKGEND